MSGTGINSAPEVIYPYKCSGSHDPAYPPAECPECRAWVEKHYPGFSVEDASTPIDPPIPLKHGGFLTVQRWHVLKTADGRVICGGTNAEGVIGSVAYQLHRWGTAESPKPTANAADQSAEDAGCNCSRNMPYFHWSHARTCPLYVPMPQPVPSAPSPAGETASEDWFPYPVAAPIAPAAVSDNRRGFELWLSREQWGFVSDGLIEHAATLRKRKGINPESTADETVQQVEAVIQIIGDACPIKYAKPSAEGDGQYDAFLTGEVLHHENRLTVTNGQLGLYWHDDAGHAHKLGDYITPEQESAFRERMANGWKPRKLAEGDGWIAELRDGLKLVRLALADEDLDGVPTWTRMRFWLNQRDIYNGDLQEHRVTSEVVKKLLTLLPAPPSGQGEGE